MVCDAIARVTLPHAVDAMTHGAGAGTVPATLSET